MKIPVPQLLISFCISCCLSAMMPPNVDAEQSKEYFIQHPVSQSVTLNSTFTLACRFLVSLFQGASPDSPKPVVQWVRNKFGLGATREDIQEAGMETNSPISRYDLPYNLDEGQYDLQIRYATSLDEGKYVCQLHYGRNTYFSQTADVRVLVASEPPELAQSDASTSNIVKRVGPQVFATATEGTYMRLHCFARNGKPGPKLFWFLNGSPLSILYNENGTEGQITSPIEGNVSVKSISSGVPPFLVTTVSEIVVYVTKLHHGSKIQCNAQNEGYENHPLEPAYTKLNILYAPLVQMHISSVTGRRQLMENDVVNIRCSAEGRPDNFTWSWMINESLVEGENSDVYRIRLSREIINTTVTCIASTFAEGYKKTTLSFLYGPKFKSPDPLIYAGAVGEPLRMHCSADGNPSPEIEWRLAGTNGPSAVLMRNEYFIRDKIHQNDFGIYICTAKSAGYPSVSKKIILAKKSAPKIKPTEPVYAAIGSPARLPCTINAIPLPPPEGLHWFRREIILRPSSHRKFSTQEFLGGIIYVMSFSHVMSTDFGFYNCSAVNAYGSDWQTIELRRDDELSIASLSGIIAALVAAVFFALLLFFYCRRRQYPKPSLKGKTLSKVTGRQNSEFLNNSYGYTRTNKLPQMLGADSKDDTFYFQSSSGSTDAETLSRYHLPSTTIRGSSEHAGLTAQSPSSIASTPITDQCLSVRPFSPVCKYTLIDGSGQNIPVCPNVVTFTGQPGDLHLTSEGGAALCIASDYQPIPITYVNLPAATRMASVAQEGPIAQRVGVVPATPVLPDSDIIVNTQVTDV